MANVFVTLDLTVFLFRPYFIVFIESVNLYRHCVSIIRDTTVWISCYSCATIAVVVFGDRYAWSESGC